MQWIREGGLFVIVCNLITVFKYILLQFLPAAAISAQGLCKPADGGFWLAGNRSDHAGSNLQMEHFGL